VVVGQRSSRIIEGEKPSNRLKWVVVALVIAALLELTLWRTFSRVGIFIPRQGTFQTVYQIATQIGVILLNLAVLLGVLSVILSIARLRQLGGNRDLPMVIAIVGTIMVGGLTFIQLALVQNIVLTFLLRTFLLVMFGGVAVACWQRHTEWQKRLFATLLFGAIACQIIARTLLDAAVTFPALGGLNEFYLPLLLFGELVVLVNGVGAWLAYTPTGQHPARVMRQNWRAAIGAAALTLTFMAVTALTSNVAQTAIVPILGLYALGYTMQLPLALYVIALFFFLYTVFYNLSKVGQGTSYQAAAFGLILVFTGGYVYNISNQYLLALMGVLLLARPELLKTETEENNLTLTNNSGFRPEAGH
jgi:hypothetical protein